MPKFKLLMIPQKYDDWFKSLGFREISFGYGGLSLCLPAEIEANQVGYSRSPEGESLCDGSSGSWKTNWVVIGNDTLTGDPLILDTGNSNFPVMTDMPGEGVWNPRLIATSLDAFAFALKTIQKVSVGRADPVQLEENPLSKEELDQSLQAIRSKNSGEIDMEFWSLILESDL
ncbi:MAG: hypothetical protein LAO78_25030 [Acidobacteriia bacterium]|nr:hypothetical protein [Terriglobia bacterium]